MTRKHARSSSNPLARPALARLPSRPRPAWHLRLLEGGARDARPEAEPEGSLRLRVEALERCLSDDPSLAWPARRAVADEDEAALRALCHRIGVEVDAATLACLLDHGSRLRPSLVGIS